MNSKIVGNMPYLATLPSCKLYLRGMNGSNILDWSPAKNTVTNGGGVSLSATSQKFPPSSLSFNNSSTGYLTVPNANFVFGTNPTVISLKFKRNATGNQYIFGMQNSGGTVYWGAGFAASNIVQLFSNGAMNLSGTATITDTTTWHQYDLIYAGGTGAVTQYIDSVQDATKLSTGGFTNPGSVLEFGFLPYQSGSLYLSANLDEIAIWTSSTGQKLPTITDLSALPKTRRMIVG